MYDRSPRFGEFSVICFGCKIVHGCGGRAGGPCDHRIGRVCDSALDFPTADPFTVIEQATVIIGSTSITLQSLQCGSTARFAEAGSDDERRGSGLPSAASLVSSVSVFLPSVGPLPSPAPRIEPGPARWRPGLGALLDARRERGCFWG